MNGLDPVPGVRETARAYLNLELVLDRARAIQWDRAPHSGGSGVNRRSAGGYSDPTCDTVADPRRENVSSEVKRAEDVLRVIADQLSAAITRLNAAIDAWEGDPQ